MTRSRRSTPSAPPPGHPALTRPRSEVLKELEERITLGRELQNRKMSSNADFEIYEQASTKWREYNEVLLKRFFTTELIAKEYTDAIQIAVVYYKGEQAFQFLHENVERQILKLESVSERLGLYAEPVFVEAREATPIEHRGSKVFVVHGHDEGAREAVARFIQALGFQPIILHERANEGRTVIEKVEAHGDVGFAVVLLTPDDEGCEKGRTPGPRARQNVVLELGYFIGRLGRNRVCALKRGELEIPSDFGGVVYEPFDASGGWKLALGRELRAAGFEIDWNKVHE